MEIEVNLRVDNVTGEHVYCSLFMDGVLCGKLTFKKVEYQLLATCILLGIYGWPSSFPPFPHKLVDKSDDSKFVEWSESQKKKNLH